MKNKNKIYSWKAHQKSNPAYPIITLIGIGIYISCLALVLPPITQALAGTEVGGQVTKLAPETDLCTLDSVICPGEARLPIAKDKEYRQVSGLVTAYNSVEWQTDSTPCYGAGGYICDMPMKVVANNCLPIGTQVEIMGTMWTVKDRMNSRYGCENFDLYFGGEDMVKEAQKFGSKKMPVKIIK